MRLNRAFVLLLVLGGVSLAQETNFSVGPQYLVTTGNPMLLGPIATPSLSLTGETLAGTSEVPRPIEVPAFAPVETIVFLNDVYWGEHKPEEGLSRRVETPSMTPEQTQWYMNLVASQTTAGQAPPSPEMPETVTSPNVIELTGGPLPANLPASILDTGVTGVADPQALLQRGYGVSLGEAAAYWKTHKRRAPRVFTNQDLRRK